MNIMNAQVTDLSSVHVIRVNPNFDDPTYHPLETSVFQAQEAHGKHILLDFEAVPTIDSRGLGKLFLAYHHLNRNHIRLGIVNPCPAVREMLDFVNLSKVVTIFGSVEEAMKTESGGLGKAPSQN